MKISELAKKSGVSKHTIRYYEQIGMIKGSALPAGSRLYGEYDTIVLDTVLMIKQLQGLGFTLNELKKYMHDYRFIKNDELEIQRVMKNKIIELEEKQKLLGEVISTIEFRLEYGHYPDKRFRLIK
jgi:MerR family Zn(II)-responsive transcriptional regulator of zntA